MTRAVSKPSLLFASAALVLLAACQTLISHDEYAAYKAVRYAEDDRSRLLAMQEYVAAHPNGQWAQSYETERAEREDELWGELNTSTEGLEFYMQAYPEGRFTNLARSRLAALETVSGRRQGERQRQTAAIERERIAQAEQARSWVTQAVQFWTRQMLTIRNYGSPIARVASANPRFSQVFGQTPRPQCQPGSCIKRYGQLYYIPVPGGTRLDRQIDVYLRLVLEGPRVNRIELLLPNKGFSRWYELENQEVIADQDPEARELAVNWAMDRINPVIREVAAAARDVEFELGPLAELPEVAGEDTEEAPEVATAEEPTVAEETPSEETEGEPSELDLLLAEAANVDVNEGEQTNEPPPEPVAEPEPEVIVPPTNLLSREIRNVRMVVFAAGAEDYGTAFDGLFVELTDEE